MSKFIEIEKGVFRDPTKKRIRASDGQEMLGNTVIDDEPLKTGDGEVHGKQIFIPFLSRFEKPMRDGVKTLTAQSKKYGEAGDWFVKFGMKFRLVKVEKISLLDVASHWREEGCRDFGDFLDVWRGIHPIRGYDPKWMLYAHRFVRIK